MIKWPMKSGYERLADYLLAPHIRALGRHWDVHQLHHHLAPNVQIRLPVQQLQYRQAPAQPPIIKESALIRLTCCMHAFCGTGRMAASSPQQHCKYQVQKRDITQLVLA